MGPAVGTIGRVLVHEALAIFAADLCDLLLRHLTLWRHPVSRHGLTVTWTRRDSVGWVRIVSRIIPRWAVTLRYRISWGHVALHWLWHAAWRDKCNLCLAGEIRATFDLDDSLDTVLHCSPAPSRPAGRNTYAKRKSLSWTTAKVVRPRHLDVSREQDVLSALSFLNPLIVRKRHPDHLFVILKHPSLYSNPQRLDVFLSLHVDFPNDAFSLNKCRLVKTNPDLALRRSQMIKQAHFTCSTQLFLRCQVRNLSRKRNSDNEIEGSVLEKRRRARLCQKV